MSWFRRKPTHDDRLLGRWMIDPADANAVESFGEAEIEFDDAGRLNYMIKSDGKVEVILMTYRVEGDLLITDQPSHPQVERSPYRLEEDVMTLTFEGVTARFIRASLQTL